MARPMARHFVHLIRDRRAAISVEYALIGTLVALGVGVALTGALEMLRLLVASIQLVLAGG
jgi:Flp pilus assembly pilin Flp